MASQIMSFLEARWRNLPRLLGVAVAVFVFLSGNETRLQIGRQQENAPLSRVAHAHAVGGNRACLSCARRAGQDVDQGCLLPFR